MSNKLNQQAKQIQFMQLVHFATILEDIRRNEAHDVDTFPLDIETFEYYGDINNIDREDVYMGLIHAVANRNINLITRAKAIRIGLDQAQAGEPLINPQYDLGFVQNHHYQDQWTANAIDQLINDVKDQATYVHVPTVA